MPLYAPPTSQIAKVSGKQLAQGSTPYETQQVELDGGRRRRWVGPAVIGAALAAGALAFAMGGADPQPTHPHRSAVAASAAAPAPAPAGAAGTATLVELPPDSPPGAAGAARPPAAGSARGDAEVEMPATMISSPPSRAERKRPARARASAERVAAMPPAPPAPVSDAATVQAKFRSVLREYRWFKEHYGSRLEGEWADIATDAQYARSADKLRDLDRKLDRFRAEMKSAQ
jgi:hypothetical protein